MARLGMFNLMTLDGFYKGAHEDISWHNFSMDEQEMSDHMSNQGNTLVFGRVTYEMMKSYWTSEEAQKNDPVTAKGMNTSPKIVFSKTLKSADWQNSQLISGDLVNEMRRLKKESETDLCILGSGQIVGQLSEAGLIDDYSILLNPLAIGSGTPLFKGLNHKLDLKLRSCKPMKSGNVLLNYIRE